MQSIENHKALQFRTFFIAEYELRIPLAESTLASFVSNIKADDTPCRLPYAPLPRSLNSLDTATKLSQSMFMQRSARSQTPAYWRQTSFCTPRYKAERHMCASPHNSWRILEEDHSTKLSLSPQGRPHPPLRHPQVCNSTVSKTSHHASKTTFP